MKASVNPSRAEICTIMADGRWRSQSEIIAQMHISQACAAGHLSTLVVMGLLRKEKRAGFSIYAAEVTE